MAVGVPRNQDFQLDRHNVGWKDAFKTPMLFTLDFCFNSSCSLTGIMMAASPFDWQLSLSYFVVAHFHYVIVGGIHSRSSPRSITGIQK